MSVKENFDRAWDLTLENQNANDTTKAKLNSSKVVMLRSWGFSGRIKVLNHNRVLTHWTAPDVKQIKVNTNGVAKGNSGPTRAGALGRDSKGLISFTVAKPLGY